VNAKVTITIAGYEASGKSAVSQIVVAALRKAGLLVGIQDPGGVPLTEVQRTQVIDEIKHKVQFEVRVLSAVRPPEKTTASGQ
jgi:hypothetical protein